MLIGSKAMPNFRQGLSSFAGDFSKQGQQSNVRKFMIKNAFIDEFLDYADEGDDEVYNYIF